MSREYSDLQIARISLFFGMVMGAVLTIVLPGSAKLVYIQFQLMCTILLLLSLLVPKTKGVKWYEMVSSKKIRNCFKN